MTGPVDQYSDQKRWGAENRDAEEGCFVMWQINVVEQYSFLVHISHRTMKPILILLSCFLVRYHVPLPATNFDSEESSDQ